MRPLSDVLPKPALPLPEGPVVSSALRLARRAGVARIVVNTSHLPQRLEAAIAECRAIDVDLAVSREDDLMGTSGALALAHHRGLLPDGEPVLVINADGDLDLDLEPLIRRHLESKDRVTLAVQPHPDPARWSQVMIDHAGTVTAVLPPGPTTHHRRAHVFPGVMLVASDALRELPVAPHDTPETLWWPALEAGRLGAAAVAGSWREIGTPPDYLGAVQCRLEKTSVVHPTATVGRRARLIGSLIGRAAVIGDRATVEGSVVAEGARVESGARVARSVVLGDVQVAGGTTVEDRFLAVPR